MGFENHNLTKGLFEIAFKRFKSGLTLKLKARLKKKKKKKKKKKR
jgi:hypothetical protein